MKNYKNLTCFLTCFCHVIMISSLPLEDLSEKHNSNESLTFNNTKIATNDDDGNPSNTTDSQASASANNPQKFNLPITMKPRGFHLPKNRPAQSRQDSAQPAAQNYYPAFFTNLTPLGHSRPYYPLTDDTLSTKFLSHQDKQYQSHEQSLSAYDASILGSGDFGVLKGGTFYPDDETPYNNDEEGSDFYYGEASNAHAGPSTEGFIQKYTYPEEQFAQFRDFADLSTPADSAYSQYVVVYAAKNSTRSKEDSKPKNIFEQLQEIDKEKALENKKLKKTSTTKLKLVKTKLTKKKWIKKKTEKTDDDDPLIALS